MHVMYYVCMHACVHVCMHVCMYVLTSFGTRFHRTAQAGFELTLFLRPPLKYWDYSRKVFYSQLTYYELFFFLTE